VDALQRAIGVTRVARVTGLDRSGIEVACAVRPLGYVLQVANGKGESWDEAQASALSEAAELWAAERPRDLVYGSARELPDAWEPQDLVAPRLWSRDTRVAWRRARELSSGRELLVPAQAVHCPPRSGLRSDRPPSAGHQRHGRPPEAVVGPAPCAARGRRAGSARARPSAGWTPAAIAQRKLDVSGLPLWRRLRDAKLEAHVFDLSGLLPVAGAILVDLEDGPVPLTAGYACGLRPLDAVRGAILEAAQSRLTDVHGAREDVEPSDASSNRALRAACERARLGGRCGQCPHIATSAGRSVARAWRSWSWSTSPCTW